MIAGHQGGVEGTIGAGRSEDDSLHDENRTVGVQRDYWLAFLLFNKGILMHTKNI